MRFLPLLRSYFAHIRALTLCRYASTKMYKHILWYLHTAQAELFTYDMVPRIAFRVQKNLCGVFLLRFLYNYFSLYFNDI